MRKIQAVTMGLVLMAFWIAAYVYPSAPDMMASHWNYRGEVDGYMPKFWGLFMLPIILLVIFLLFSIIPKVDPLKENISKFQKYFDGFILLLVLFLLYIYILTIFWSWGVRFNMMEMMVPAMGALFYYCGILMEKAKPNWFVGIRNPWTLSSEKVWNKTHKLGGKLFRISGIIAVAGILVPDYSIFLVLVPIIFSSFYLTAYSYFEYKKETKKGRR